MLTDEQYLEDDDNFEEDEEYPTELYPVLELSDAIFDLVERLEKVSKKLDNYEQEYLEADVEVRQSLEQPDPQILERWDGFISRVIMDFDNLGDLP